MNVKTLLVVAILVSIFILGYFSNRNLSKEKLYKHTDFALGTIVEIQLYEVDENLAKETIKSAFKEIKRIDENFSAYNEKSQIYQINKSNEKRIQLTSEVYDVLKLCDSIYKVTNGSFDCALGKVTFLWKDFLLSEKIDKVPLDSEIKNRLKESGWENIKLEDKVLIKTRNVEFDLGAIAKGYAVDKAIDVLKSFGVKKALVNAGGEIKTIGDGWIIGIQHPREKGKIIEKIKLDNKAVATSGDYEQFKFVNGKRYHHIIEPANGYPSTKCISVTVIADNVTYADGLATGIFNMGAKQGLMLINSLPDVEALIIESENIIHMSEGFKKYFWR